MKCLRCDSDNREGAKFCSNCGESLGIPCPQCGTRSLPSAQFCDACGLPLTEKAEARKIDYGNPTSYMPKVLADTILRARASIEGERKLVSVLFVDVANYTSISEHLDPEEIHHIMDQCLKLIMDEIHRYEGTITQFTGDGVMALFGAPIAHEDHAQRAGYAALAIQKSMRDFGATVWMDYGVDFAVRVGINSGLVIVGTIGDDLRMDYTALGDTTNLASRMETMAAPGSILVSHDTYKLIKDFFQFRSLGALTVKGKTEPLEAFELVGASEIETRMGAAVVRGLTKFVGRERELKNLEKAFENVREGCGQVIGIVGEAGVGKSRLVMEFRKVLSGTDHTYLEGRCFHFGSSMAYLPVIDILRSYFNVTEGMQEFVIKKTIGDDIRGLDPRLATIEAPIHELLSLRVEDESYLRLEPKFKRERIFESVRDLMVRESETKPVILVVEDLHWIDKTTEEFLSYFIDWVCNARILLILLYRPEYVHSWGSKSHYMRIGLGQLPAIASSELVISLLEGAETCPELREFIIGRAGGNPLFMEELTYALLEGGDIRRSDNKYSLSRKVWEIRVPDTIQGIIAARMDLLDAGSKRTLQTAAVIGREFPYPILEMIMTGQPDLKLRLLELQASEFIYEISVIPEVEYAFKHALVHEVAYNSLLLRRRREVHEKIGNAIEKLYGERLEEFYETLAYHYTKSENREKACHYLKAAGAKASRSSSLWEAFRFFRDAINVLKDQGFTNVTAAERVEITLKLITPMLALGFPEDSLYILQSGEGLAREIGDVRALTSLCSAIGLYFSLKGDTMRGLQYNEECFKVARQEQDIDLMAPVGFDLCANYTARGEFLKTVAIAPEIIARLEASGKEFESFGRGYNLFSALAGFNGFALAYLGDYEQGRIILDKGLTLAEKIGNLYSLGLIEVFYGYSYCHQGNGERALPRFERAITYLEKGQIFVLLGLAWSGVGWSHYFMGEPATAVLYLEKGLEIHTDANVAYNLSVHHWFLSAVHCDLGNLERAKGYADEAIRLAETNNEIYYVALGNITLGRIIGKQGLEIPKAEAAIRRGITILEELKITPQVAVGHLVLAELYGERSQPDKANPHFTRAVEIFREKHMDRWIGRAESLISLVQRP